MQDRQRVPHNNDEIDLHDLFVRLWQNKWQIFLVTLISTTIGLTYIWIVKPTYKAAVHILPPTSGDIAQLNYKRSNKEASLLHSFSPKYVYNVFTDALLSHETKHTFFQNYFLPDLPLKYQKKPQKMNCLISLLRN